MAKTYGSSVMAVMAIICTASTALAGNHGADTSQAIDISSDVAGHAGIRYFDLLKQIFPDLVVIDGVATAHKAVTLRHIAGSDHDDALPDPVQIGSLQVLRLKAEGKPKIAVLANVGTAYDRVEQPVVLAIFDDDANPKLLDAVDVGMDKMSSFGVPALVTIAPSDQAIVTNSQHFNSNESYTATTLSFINDGKLSLIDQFLTYGLRTCRSEYSQKLTFESKADAVPGRYFSLVASVVEKQRTIRDGCGDIPAAAPYSTRVSATYRWIPEKSTFSADSDALTVLQKKTEEQF